MTQEGDASGGDRSTARVKAARGRTAASVRPMALVAVGTVSVQTGAAIATQLFDKVGPAGAVTLRLVFASAALIAISLMTNRWPRSARTSAQSTRKWSDALLLVAFGFSFAGMNLSFYEAISRIPLGVAVTIEFLGPLALAVSLSRRRTDVLWALLAGAGVFLVSAGDVFGSVRHLDSVGIALSLIAGALSDCYILLNSRVGRRFRGTSGLAGAMVVGALIVLPLGIASAGSQLVRPGVMAMGAAVAGLSSVVPYTCEFTALRSISPRTFGVLLSIEPAIASLVGLLLLGQRLSAIEVVAVSLVVAANAGNSWDAIRTGVRGLERSAES